MLYSDARYLASSSLTPTSTIYYNNCNKQVLYRNRENKTGPKTASPVIDSASLIIAFYRIVIDSAISDIITGQTL
jgi:hypothetical protein